MHEEVKTMGERVGYVINIEGKKLMYTRRFPSGRIGSFQAYVRMAIYINDHLQTDKDTQAALEFYIGGQAVISINTEVVVVGKRDIEVVGNTFIVKAGKFNAKIDKQRAQLQIQTGGGVIGIEG